MPSNKFKRDFYQYGALKRPGRIDRDLFQHMEDCGDGYGGIQWMMYKAFGLLLFPKFVIEGCAYNGVDTLAHGYIMYNGDPIQVSQQAVVVGNGEWLYIDHQGNAHTTGVEATARIHVVIYERDGAGTGYDVRFRLDDNILRVLRITVQDLIVNQNTVITGNANIAGDVSIGSDLEVDGVSQLDDTEVDGTLDVSGITDMHDVLDMNANRIEKVADPTANQDAVTRTYLRNFMPVGTILMYNGVGWTDNVSMVGWYQCNAANVAHGVPDLEDKFIRASAVSGAGAGADTVTLVANQIPTHTSGGQSATHNHVVTINNNTANHHHSGTTNSTTHTHTLDKMTAGTTKWGVAIGNDVGNFTFPAGGAHTHTMTTGNQSANHNHTNTVGNASVDHTHTYNNAAQPINNMPVYYKLIFVMRTV